MCPFRVETLQKLRATIYYFITKININDNSRKYFQVWIQMGKIEITSITKLQVSIFFHLVRGEEQTHTCTH